MSNDQTTKIVEKLDKQDEQFIKLFSVITQLQSEFAEVKEGMAAMVTKDEFFTAIDGLHKLAEDQEIENGSLGMKVDRHEEFIITAADKLAIKYSS